MTDASPYDEKELLAKVAEGDEAAFRELFAHWHQMLAGYIFRITESQVLAEEIVQDAFMKIWMSRESLTGIHNFKHYLLVVSRNRAFDVLKKQLREQEQQRTWARENKEGMMQADDPNESVVASLIDEAIDSLPPRRKEVYLLSRHERLTYEEVASKLGISRESVKTHLKLASGSITEYIKSHIVELMIFIILLKKI